MHIIIQRVGNTRLKASGYKKKRRYARTAKITSVDLFNFLELLGGDETWCSRVIALCWSPLRYSPKLGPLVALSLVGPAKTQQFFIFIILLLLMSYSQQKKKKKATINWTFPLAIYKDATFRYIGH